MATFIVYLVVMIRNCKIPSILDSAAQRTREGEFMAIVYVGIDLAKNVFAVHGDEYGPLVQPKVGRDKPHERVAAQRSRR